MLLSASRWWFEENYSVELAEARRAAKPEEEEAGEADEEESQKQQPEEIVVMRTPTDSFVDRRMQRKRFAAKKRFGYALPERFERVLTRVVESRAVVPEYTANENNYIRVDWAAMPEELDLGGGGGGGLPRERQERKRRQIENMMGFVDALTRPGDTVVDFCSGCGHQSLPLAYLRPQVQFVLLDRKQRSLDVAERRVRELGLTNVRVICGDVGDFKEHNFQVAMSLHGCGGATDDVLDMCCKRGAAFVVCPCCVGAAVSDKSFNCSAMNYPRSSRLREVVSHDDYAEICRAADTNPTARTAKGASPTSIDNRRLCKSIIEADRLQRASDQNYTTILALMVPPSASPKNDILVGWPNDSSPRGASLCRDRVEMPWLDHILNFAAKQQIPPSPGVGPPGQGWAR